MCDENGRSKLICKLEVLDYAKTQLRELLAIRHEYAAEFPTTDFQKLNEAAVNLTDVVLTASVRIKALYDAEEE